MKCYSRRLTRLLCLSIACFILSISPALAIQDAKRILTLPLTIHSQVEFDATVLQCDPRSGDRGYYISNFSLRYVNGDDWLEAVYARVTGSGFAQAKSRKIVVEPMGSLSEKQSGTSSGRTALHARSDSRIN